MEVVKIKSSPALTKIRKDLLKAIENISQGLIERGRLKNVGVLSFKELLELRKGELNVEERSAITSLIRLYHCLDLVESHGVEPFISFCGKIFSRRGRSAIQLRDEHNLKAAYETARGMTVVGEEHPKVTELKRTLERVGKDDRVIVFTNYKDTTKMLYEKALSWGLDADYLIGKRGEFSQSQKEQLETLNKLNLGLKKILFATRVGEEGLDIVECNLVIFYDSVSDAIRFIQRKGRTGRKKKGRVVVLVMEGSREEILFWIGKRRIEKMKQIISVEKNGENLIPLEHFIEEEKGEIKIVVDKRENMSIKLELGKLDVNIVEQMLDVGDFVLSEDVCVERKTLKDFVDSIIDGRLFSQLIQLKQKYVKPILFLEKGSQTDRITQNAFLGALASVITDFGVPLITTQSPEESALLLYIIAKREQIQRKKSVKIREGEKPVDIKEVQRYILAGIPSVNSILASRLLEKFGTLQNIFNSSEEDLMKVKGIGEVIAKKIREIATMNYNETLK
ncbi:MAG: ERCC4 domain-containing protein [Nitrososphaeria archaeon]